MTDEKKELLKLKIGMFLIIAITGTALILFYEFIMGQLN